MKTHRALLNVALGLGLFATVSGCATQRAAPPIRTQAPLGRVIVYRNGVAYFERRATVQDKLQLRVPLARVDDFLKSLTVTDVKTGKPIPISYPTKEQLGSGDGGTIQMTLDLPKGRRDVRITYVTESPAWKPSYRVILGKGGRAKLQSWAVVDNVSGEAWERVTVGVGSTSALSFRFDLHSVRNVERETLSSKTAVAAAPPTGTTTFRNKGGKARVLANLGDEAIDGKVLETTANAHSRTTGGHRFGTTVDANQEVDNLVVELQKNKDRIQIQGYRWSGAAEDKHQAQSRASRLRDRLVARGIDATRIEIVGRDQQVDDPNQVVQVVTQQEAEQDVEAIAEAPLGSALFVASGPMSIKAGHSAMVSMIDSDTPAQRVYVYDPSSRRGNERFAFNAVRLENPSDYTLDSGPLTVYADGEFLGEGLTDPIPPHTTAFVPYALDRLVVADPTVSTREEIDRLVAVQRGVVKTETHRVRKTELNLHNRGTSPAKVWIRHRVPRGWTLRHEGHEPQKLGTAYLLPVTLKAGGTKSITIEETRPSVKTIDLSTDAGVAAVELYLQHRSLEGELGKRLDEILARHRSLHDLGQRLSTRREQMAIYRQRVTELNIQLVTLRKVRKAQRLSAHLAKKMRQLTDRLDAATVEVTDLEGQRLTVGIELQDLIADLTLSPKHNGEKDQVATLSPGESDKP